MGVKTILPLALVVGACGTEMVSMEPDNSNTNNTPSLDSSMPNVHDSGYKAPDAGVPTPLDAGYAPDVRINSMDAGIANIAPTIKIRNPMPSGPIQFRRNRPSELEAEVTDPDGDSNLVRCTWEVRDSNGRMMYNSNGACKTNVTLPDMGNYMVTASATDNYGARTMTNAPLQVVANVAPIANAGPDVMNLTTDTPYCFVYGACGSHPCRDGPYAPGHSSTPFSNYDPDGASINHETYFDADNWPDVSQSGPCVSLSWSEPGTYNLTKVSVDPDGARTSDNAIIVVTRRR